MEFLSWNPLWWLFLVLGLGAVARWSLVDRPKTMKWISLSGRMVAVICLILALCRPFWASDRDDVHVTFLLDVSESVDVDSMSNGLGEIQDGIDQLERDDSYQIFLFANGVRQVSMDEAREYVDKCKAGRSDAEFRSETHF